MALQNNKQKYSFARLFNEEAENGSFKIEIPLIQRDYAQGRTTDKVNDLRIDFVNALYDYLIDDEDTHELDFVYGSSEYSSQKSKKFIPLDGQQRLTTLFLLHWYLAQRTKGKECSNEFVSLISNGDPRNPVSKFYYRTRRSATDFCNELVGMLYRPIDFSQLKTITKIVDGKEKKIPSVSRTIRNMNWYSPLWDNDPTIKSMLVMLDELHSIFGNADHEKFLKKLLDKDNPAIGFTFMDLDEYKLTEDLYIKMNSRGKPLTSFENFKAKFEQYIGEVENDEIFEEKRKEISLRFDKKESPIKDVKQYFSFNIDTTWTNFFWAYCLDELAKVNEDKKENALEKNLDTKISNFIRVILTNSFAITNKNSLNKSILVDKEGHPELSFNQYARINALTPYGINLLIDSLNAINNGNSKLKSIIPESIFFHENEVIENSLRNDLGYVMRARLHAYLVFIIAFGNKNAQDLDAWMHFAYNLTHSPNLESPISADNFYIHLIAFNGLIKLMKEKGISNIDDFLVSKPKDYNLGFKTTQEQEEIIKAHLRNIPPSEDINWKKAIEKYEDYSDSSYFNGQIESILEMSGICDYYFKHGNCGWDEEDNKVFFRSFCRYGDIALEIFKGGYDGRIYAPESVLERAMAALHPEYIDISGNMLNSSLNKYNIRRDISWKRRMHTPYDHSVNAMLKDLFDKIELNENEDLSITIRDQLNEIIRNNQPKQKWLKVLVNSPELMNHSPYGFISCQKGQHILHAGKRDSGGDKELFTLDLYLSKIQDHEDQFPEMDVAYQSANNSYHYPHIRAIFTFGGFEHILKLEHHPIDDDFGNFFFSVNVVNSSTNERTEHLEETLSDLGFTPHEWDPKIFISLLSPDLSYEEILERFRNVYSNLNRP